MKTIIDISEWQDPSAIDYDALAHAIDGAIIRVGFTGWGGSGASLHEDDSWREHYDALVARGVPCGAYWYGCADTVTEAEAEAKALLRYIEGLKFELPICYDVEDEHHMAACSPAQLTAVVRAFLEVIEDAGYYAMYYMSAYWQSAKIIAGELSAYDLWIAHWTDDPEPRCDREWGIWQYTSDGRLPGYSGRLDTNRTEKDYPSIIREAGLNHLSPAPTPKSEDHPAPIRKTTAELAAEVWEGKWGNGSERRERLSKAGYDYDDVQAEVNRTAPASAEPSVYIVQSGDTLWGIAEDKLGDGSRYCEIMRLNGLTSSDIYPGDVLKIPD